MSMRLALAAATLAGLVCGSLALASSPTKLKGTVGPGFTISLKDASGKKVTSLKAGTYSFTIVDKSTIHDFTLTGPGVSNRHLTSLPFTGTKSNVAVTLKAGTYRYFCSLHGFGATFTVK